MEKSITQKTVATDSSFDQVGLMLDLSRGKVLTVKTIKNIIDEASAFGFTYINMYLEDLITLEDYPQYGYMRGKYSDAEIISLVDYAHTKGLEIFPAIQTLGHLEHFLRWEQSNKIKDTETVLNVTTEETYDFIEALIKKCKLLFGGNKINIGMDEAFDLGHGSVFRRGNQLSRKELYLNHLNRVTEICINEGYDVIKIWSDMLFSTYSQADGESLYATNFKAEIENLNPALELIFWNYWTEEQTTYEKILDAHHKFSGNVSMALGIHTWGIPFYNLNQLNVSQAALQACENKGVKDVLFTMWGDDGSLYNIDSISLGMYETMAHILNHKSNSEEFNMITGKDYDQLVIACRILKLGINPLHVIWNDPITNIYLKTIGKDKLREIAEKCQVMKTANEGSVLTIYNLYLDCVENDINIYLEDTISEQLITKAYNDLKKLYSLLEQDHINYAKINGVEELQIRFEHKLNRYMFLYKYQNENDIKELRNENVETIEWMKTTYNNISKATQFRW